MVAHQGQRVWSRSPESGCLLREPSVVLQMGGKRRGSLCCCCFGPGDGGNALCFVVKLLRSLEPRCHLVVADTLLLLFAPAQAGG